ncbi:hypothetical protein KAT92_05090 [Candidatus Babeliales bacterium]|nr:hypothetical protein [Candidatus Babeliales bacterium]
MNNSKKTQRIIKNIDDVIDVLDYYMFGRNEYIIKLKEVRDFISELGLDKKKSNARLAKRLKKHWETQQDESK